MATAVPPPPRFAICLTERPFSLPYCLMPASPAWTDVMGSPPPLSRNGRFTMVSAYHTAVFTPTFLAMRPWSQTAVSPAPQRLISARPAGTAVSVSGALLPQRPFPIPAAELTTVFLKRPFSPQTLPPRSCCCEHAFPHLFCPGSNKGHLGAAIAGSAAASPAATISLDDTQAAANTSRRLQVFGWVSYGLVIVCWPGRALPSCTPARILSAPMPGVTI